MWLSKKIRSIENKLTGNKKIKVSSDFRPSLQKLKKKAKELEGTVKELKAKDAKVYSEVKSMYRNVRDAFATGQSVASIEKSKKPGAGKKTEAPAAEVVAEA